MSLIAAGTFCIRCPSRTFLLMNVLILLFSSSLSFNSFNAYGLIVLNIRPASDNNLLNDFVSAAVNVTLPEWSCNIASTCQTDGISLSFVDIAFPKLACIESRVEPLYVVCQTTPILDRSICLPRSESLGIA